MSSKRVRPEWYAALSPEEAFVVSIERFFAGDRAEARRVWRSRPEAEAAGGPEQDARMHTALLLIGSAAGREIAAGMAVARQTRSMGRDVGAVFDAAGQRARDLMSADQEVAGPFHLGERLQEWLELHEEVALDRAASAAQGFDRFADDRGLSSRVTAPVYLMLEQDVLDELRGHACTEPYVVWWARQFDEIWRGVLGSAGPPQGRSFSTGR